MVVSATEKTEQSKWGTKGQMGAASAASNGEVVGSSLRRRYGSKIWGMWGNEAYLGKGNSRQRTTCAKPEARTCLMCFKNRKEVSVTATEWVREEGHGRGSERCLWVKWRRHCRVLSNEWRDLTEVWKGRSVAAVVRIDINKNLNQEELDVSKLGLKCLNQWPSNFWLWSVRRNTFYMKTGINAFTDGTKAKLYTSILVTHAIWMLSDVFYPSLHYSISFLNFLVIPQ